jgi:phosphatidyl-myo-inositol alpha-mannosyltransferase
VRVLLACPYAWDAPGGVQTHVRQLALQLRERGHEVLVLTPARGPVADPFVRVAGRAVSIPYQGTVAPIAPWPGALRRVGRELAAFRAQLVHVHEPLTPSTSMYAAIRSRVPTVATFHAYADRSALLDVAAPALRPVWRRLSVRIAVSQAAAWFVTSRFGGEVRVIPNGVDVRLFSSGEPAAGLPPGRRLLWVGRLDPQKGFPVAVAAFGALAPELPDLSFVVIGDGRDRDAVRSLPPDVRTRVIMLGPVPHDRLPDYHAVADAFISPATGQETFGLVLVEAMAAGVPVVASDIPGYREVVTSGLDGMLVPPGDAESLARAVRAVLDDPPTAERLRRAGRARAAHFDWSVVIAEIESAYHDALAGAEEPR